MERPFGGWVLNVSVACENLDTFDMYGANNMNANSLEELIKLQELAQEQCSTLIRRIVQIKRVLGESPEQEPDDSLEAVRAEVLTALAIRRLSVGKTAAAVGINRSKAQRIIKGLVEDGLVRLGRSGRGFYAVSIARNSRTDTSIQMIDTKPV